MRAPWLLATLVALLAGCAASYPAGSRIVTEVEVSELAPGEALVHNFTLSGDAGFLAMGFRHPPRVVLHLALRSPAGTLYDLQAGEVPVPCAVAAPQPGPWALEVRPDILSEPLPAAKFTVRAAPGAPPASVFRCVDDLFPGAGRNVTLGAWPVNLTAAGIVDVEFDQPYALAALTARLAGGNGTEMFSLTPPGGVPSGAANATVPAQGRWALRLETREPVTNATLAVHGTGS